MNLPRGGRRWRGDFWNAITVSGGCSNIELGTIKPYATRRYNDLPRYRFLPSFWENCSKMISGRPGLGAVSVGCAGAGADAGATAAFMAFPFDRLGCWKNIATQTANVPAGLAPAERRIDHYKAFFPLYIAGPFSAARPSAGRRKGERRWGVAVLVANPSLRRRRVGGGVCSVSCNNGHQYTSVNNKCQVFLRDGVRICRRVLCGERIGRREFPIASPPRRDNRRFWGNPANARAGRELEQLEGTQREYSLTSCVSSFNSWE